MTLTPEETEAMAHLIKQELADDHHLPEFGLAALARQQSVALLRGILEKLKP